MYSKDEKVLCFHQELLYDAKILEVRLKDPSDKKSPHEYLVHYKGWKNTYVLFFIISNLVTPALGTVAVSLVLCPGAVVSLFYLTFTIPIPLSINLPNIATHSSAPPFTRPQWRIASNYVG